MASDGQDDVTVNGHRLQNDFCFAGVTLDSRIFHPP